MYSGCFCCYCCRFWILYISINNFARNFCYGIKSLRLTVRRNEVLMFLSRKFEFPIIEFICISKCVFPSLFLPFRLLFSHPARAINWAKKLQNQCNCNEHFVWHHGFWLWIMISVYEIRNSIDACKFAEMLTKIRRPSYMAPSCKLWFEYDNSIVVFVVTVDDAAVGNISDSIVSKIVIHRNGWQLNIRSIYVSCSCSLDVELSAFVVKKA